MRFLFIFHVSIHSGCVERMAAFDHARKRPERSLLEDHLAKNVDEGPEDAEAAQKEGPKIRDPEKQKNYLQARKLIFEQVQLRCA
jgi:hypothetical protein